jgi:hypothetical protein
MRLSSIEATLARLRAQVDQHEERLAWVSQDNVRVQPVLNLLNHGLSQASGALSDIYATITSCVPTDAPKETHELCESILFRILSSDHRKHAHYGSFRHPWEAKLWKQYQSGELKPCGPIKTRMGESVSQAQGLANVISRSVESENHGAIDEAKRQRVRELVKMHDVSGINREERLSAFREIIDDAEKQGTPVVSDNGVGAFLFDLNHKGQVVRSRSIDDEGNTVEDSMQEEDDRS